MRIELKSAANFSTSPFCGIGGFSFTIKIGHIMKTYQDTELPNLAQPQNEDGLQLNYRDHLIREIADEVMEQIFSSPDWVKISACSKVLQELYGLLSTKEGSARLEKLFDFLDQHEAMASEREFLRESMNILLECIRKITDKVGVQMPNGPWEMIPPETTGLYPKEPV
jgi:hypothetical protein